MHSIWDNRCPAYAAMTAKIKAQMLRDEKNEIPFPADSGTIFPHSIIW